MKGSEKQISWANKIKQEVTVMFQQFHSDGTLSDDDVKYYEKLMLVDSAKFWIDEPGSIRDDFEWLYKRAVKKGYAK